MGVQPRDKELERVLKALANRRRVAMLRYIRQKGEASMGQVAEHINLSFKATSKHLALLVGAGVLDKEQRGVQMFFWIPKGAPDIARYLLTLL